MRKSFEDQTGEEGSSRLKIKIMTMKKEMKREEKKEKEGIGHLPCSNEGVQDERCSEKALRRLSRSIEEVRLHSRHGQICACVYVLLIRSHSFFLSPSLYVFLLLHVHQRRQKRPLVYVLRIIISSLSLALFLSLRVSRFPIGGRMRAFRLVVPKKKERKKNKLLIRDCKSIVTEILTHRRQLVFSAIDYCSD